jgi:hypothetical protein
MTGNAGATIARVAGDPGDRECDGILTALQGA